MGWKFQKKHLSERLRGSECVCVGGGAWGGLGKGDGVLAKGRGSVRGWALGCQGGRGSTFSTG